MIEVCVGNGSGGSVGICRVVTEKRGGDRALIAVEPCVIDDEGEAGGGNTISSSCNIG